MPATIKTATTSRFTDPWTYLCFLMFGVTILALLMAPFWSRKLVSKYISVDPDIPTTLDPIQLQPQPIGALRVDVEARIPNNRWITYEIQLRDQQGQLLASAIKQGWNESGTWYEDGESGTWQEDDLMGGLDVRASKTEPVTLAVDILEYTTTSGQEVSEPVSFNIQVYNGAVDHRYLWAGVFGLLALSLLAWFAIPTAGRKVIAKTIPDSDVGDRAVLGGPNRLVRVTVAIKSDETSPRSLNVDFAINNENGEQIFTRTYPVKLSLTKNDGRVTSASGELHLFLMLEPQGSYGFYAEVHPDGPVDRTTLTVRDGARTLLPVTVTHLAST